MQTQTAKVILALAGILVFLVGIRTHQEMVRWTGIALVTAAWLLRFVGRGTQRRGPSTSPSEDQ